MNSIKKLFAASGRANSRRPIFLDRKKPQLECKKQNVAEAKSVLWLQFENSCWIHTHVKSKPADCYLYTDNVSKF